MNPFKAANAWRDRINETYLFPFAQRSPVLASLCVALFFALVALAVVLATR